MEISKYILLFHKKLKGEIKPEEDQALTEWMSREEGQVFARQMEKTWEASGRYKQGYEPDTAAGLARFRERLAAEKSRSSPLRASAGSRYRWMAAAAAVALLLVAGWWMLSNRASEGANILAFSTAIGETLEVPLPDGSTIILNESSLLTLAKDFRTAGSRQVELSGEAYFKVASNPNRPFVISTSETQVEVLGTAFNLRAYPDEAFTEVEVEEGLVRFKGRKSGETMKLSAGQRGICRHGKTMAERPSPELNAHSWRTHRLEFRDTPLQLALPDIERYFNVTLEVENSLSADCGLTMAFEQDSLDVVLKALQLIYHFEIKALGNGHYLLQKGGC